MAESTFRLRLSRGKHFDFNDYQVMLAALHQNRDLLDGITVDEIDEKGNVQATLSNEEVRQIVAELDAIVLPTLQSPGLKDT